jgi:hypothetical protein
LPLFCKDCGSEADGTCSRNTPWQSAQSWQGRLTQQTIAE